MSQEENDLFTRYFVSWVDAYLNLQEEESDLTEQDITDLKELRASAIKVRNDVFGCIIDDVIDCADDIKMIADQVG